MLKSLILISVLALTSTLAMAQDSSPGRNQPENILTRLYKAWVPKGFDDNDQVQFGVGGLFSNGCYRVNAVPKVEIDKVGKRIVVTQAAYLYEGICIDVMMPFYQIVTVGVVSAGEYSIIDGYTGSKIGALKVTVSTTVGPDDYLYAPVQDAYIKEPQSPGQPASVVIKGYYPEDCWSLKEVKLDLELEDEVIVIQPIA